MKQMFFIALETDRGVVMCNVIEESYDRAFHYVMDNPYDAMLPNYRDRKAIRVYNQPMDIWWMVHDKGDK